MGKIFPRVSTLKETPSAFEATLRLIEKSFHYEKPNSFLVDFAPLMDESNHHNCFILIDENENVLAHVGAKERLLGNHSVCMLGGIAVDEQYRGQGHFQMLFQDVLAEKRSDNAFFLLWSDQEKLYSKFGFHLCGGQFELEQKTGKSEFKKAAYTQEIKDLYQISFQSNYLSLKREQKDWDLLSKITSAELFIQEQNGKITDYFFLGKGQDLTGTIHEYGTKRSLIDFLNEARVHGKVWMGAPFIETENVQYQFMLAPADKRRFTDFITEYTNGQMAIREINQMKQEIFFDFNGETLVLEIPEFLRGVFGPGPFEELGELKPIFISGLDSI